MTNEQEILICGELINGRLAAIVGELLSIGRRLSDELKRTLSILLIGENIQEEANKAIALGADKVYMAKGADFAESHPEYYTSRITDVCKQTRPSIILLGQADMGREIAPRLAAKLMASVCLDCIDLSVDPANKTLLLSKPVYGGNAVAVWASADNQPQVVTVRPRAAAAAEPDPSRKGQIVQFTAVEDGSMTRGRLLETVKEKVKGIRLEEAKVIVAGGGGIGGSEGFQLIEELAEVLGGAVGITRVPCDEGWMPASHEIGQTGHMVSPDLYLAVGISGAPQHLAGCSGSKCIAAINTNPEAHIFTEADYGVVGDYRDILPTLIEKFKEYLAT